MQPFKILLYSHDTLGLGHFRRCQSIAKALAARFENTEICILTGSSVSDAYGEVPQTRLVHLPSVAKTPEGNYRAADPAGSFNSVRRQREAIIRAEVAEFDPDLCIVDKEPLGFLGEMSASLRMMKERGAMCVLGLRDVLDDAELLQSEWDKKEIPADLSPLYDQIWVYGPRDFYDPLQGLGLSDSTLGRVIYTGFIDRKVTAQTPSLLQDHVLVTAGGGGDGFMLMQSVLQAYRRRPSLPGPLLLLLGPFIASEQRQQIDELAVDIPDCQIFGFVTEPEAFVQDARLVMGMCGYNTFCETMIYDKRALFVPRNKPRREQTIRAQRANELGLCSIIDIEEARDPDVFAAAIEQALDRDRPATANYNLDFSGLDVVCEMVEDMIHQQEKPRRLAV
ncbi:glycosyltransferase family protein [Oricola sp.]|uniref:glycosyltransferase family protein n=1 Tax=Oricola sp. TaxID=1979950 RepID=UPI003BADAD6F